MDLKRIKSIVKYNKTILRLYRFFGNCLIALLKVFIKPKNNQILFMSFGGQKYDDSPKALYESIIKDPYFDKYNIVWAFVNPNAFNIPRGSKVKVDTLKFYKTAIQSKIWINNSSVQRGLNIKTNKTIELNTWHGTPLKKMGCDIETNQSYTHKEKNIGKTFYCAQSEFDRDIWIRFFNTDIKNIIISDLPRNDELVNYSQEKVLAVKRKLGIPLDKEVILYAPTFREYDRDSKDGCFINPPIDLVKWKEKLGNKYVVLFRAHYEVAKYLEIKNDGFIYDVTNYASLNELMIVSDLLISDYSSVYFDFSILERPIFCFVYDFELYKKFRGLYEKPLDSLPSRMNQNEDELLDDILNFDADNKIKQTKVFKKEFAPNAGRASEMSIDQLKALIN